MYISPTRPVRALSIPEQHLRFSDLRRLFDLGMKAYSETTRRKRLRIPSGTNLRGCYLGAPHGHESILQNYQAKKVTYTIRNESQRMLSGGPTFATSKRHTRPNTIFQSTDVSFMKNSIHLSFLRNPTKFNQTCPPPTPRCCQTTKLRLTKY